MKSYKTTDVFTPSKPASVAFVDRKGIDTQLNNALVTPGKQIVIFGHSGSGKTTLNFNSLQRYGLNSVTCRSTTDSTFDKLVLTAFDELDGFYFSEKNSSSESSISPKVESDYKLVKMSLEASFKSMEGDKRSRALPPQLTAERLAEFCGAAKCCWVLEDFIRCLQRRKSDLLSR